MINVVNRLLLHVFRQKTHIDGTLSLQKISRRSSLSQKKGRTSHESVLTVFPLDAISNIAKHDTMQQKQTFCISLTRVLFNITRRLPDAIRVQVFSW
jgi:hypothetical protein